MDLSDVESFSFLFKMMWEHIGPHDERCRLNILDTVCYKDGYPHRWIFTSEKNGEVLRRNNSRLHVKEIIRSFKARVSLLRGSPKPVAHNTKIATIYYYENVSKLSTQLVDAAELMRLMNTDDPVVEICAVQLYLGPCRLQGCGMFEHKMKLGERGAQRGLTYELAHLPQHLHLVQSMDDIYGTSVDSSGTHNPFEHTAFKNTFADNKVQTTSSQHNMLAAVTKRISYYMGLQLGGGMVSSALFYFVFNERWIPFITGARTVSLYQPSSDMVVNRDKILFFSDTSPVISHHHDRLGAPLQSYLQMTTNFASMPSAANLTRQTSAKVLGDTVPPYEDATQTGTSAGAGVGAGSGGLASYGSTPNLTDVAANLRKMVSVNTDIPRQQSVAGTSPEEGQGQNSSEGGHISPKAKQKPPESLNKALGIQNHIPGYKGPDVKYDQDPCAVLMRAQESGGLGSPQRKGAGMSRKQSMQMITGSTLEGSLPGSPNAKGKGANPLLQTHKQRTGDAKGRGRAASAGTTRPRATTLNLTTEASKRKFRQYNVNNIVHTTAPNFIGDGMNTNYANHHVNKLSTVTAAVQEVREQIIGHGDDTHMVLKSRRPISAPHSSQRAPAIPMPHGNEVGPNGDIIDPEIPPDMLAKINSTKALVTHGIERKLPLNAGKYCHGAYCALFRDFNSDLSGRQKMVSGSGVRVGEDDNGNDNDNGNSNGEEGEHKGAASTLLPPGGRHQRPLSATSRPGSSSGRRKSRPTATGNLAMPSGPRKGEYVNNNTLFLQYPNNIAEGRDGNVYYESGGVYRSMNCTNTMSNKSVRMALSEVDWLQKTAHKHRSATIGAEESGSTGPWGGGGGGGGGSMDRLGYDSVDANASTARSVDANASTARSVETSVFIQQQILQEEINVLQSKQDKIERDQILSMLAKKHMEKVAHECHKSMHAMDKKKEEEEEEEGAGGDGTHDGGGGVEAGGGGFTLLETLKREREAATKKRAGPTRKDKRKAHEARLRREMEDKASDPTHWRRMSDAYRSCVYSDAASGNVHPTRFYDNVPVCSLCFRYYTLLDHFREQMIFHTSAARNREEMKVKRYFDQQDERLDQHLREHNELYRTESDLHIAEHGALPSRVSSPNTGRLARKQSSASDYTDVHMLSTKDLNTTAISGVTMQEMSPARSEGAHSLALSPNTQMGVAHVNANINGNATGTAVSLHRQYPHVADHHAHVADSDHHAHYMTHRDDHHVPGQPRPRSDPNHFHKLHAAQARAMHHEHIDRHTAERHEHHAEGRHDHYEKHKGDHHQNPHAPHHSHSPSHDIAEGLVARHPTLKPPVEAHPFDPTGTGVDVGAGTGTPPPARQHGNSLSRASSAANIDERPPDLAEFVESGGAARRRTSKLDGATRFRMRMEAQKDSGMSLPSRGRASMLTLPVRKAPALGSPQGRSGAPMAALAEDYDDEQVRQQQQQRQQVRQSHDVSLTLEKTHQPTFGEGGAAPATATAPAPASPPNSRDLKEAAGSGSRSVSPKTPLHIKTPPRVRRTSVDGDSGPLGSPDGENIMDFIKHNAVPTPQKKQETLLQRMSGKLLGRMALAGKLAIASKAAAKAKELKQLREENTRMVLRGIDKSGSGGHMHTWAKLLANKHSGVVPPPAEQRPVPGFLLHTASSMAGVHPGQGEEIGVEPLSPTKVKAQQMLRANVVGAGGSIRRPKSATALTVGQRVAARIAIPVRDDGNNRNSGDRGLARPKSAAGLMQRAKRGQSAEDVAGGNRPSSAATGRANARTHPAAHQEPAPLPEPAPMENQYASQGLSDGFGRARSSTGADSSLGDGSDYDGPPPDYPYYLEAEEGEGEGLHPEQMQGSVIEGHREGGGGDESGDDDLFYEDDEEADDNEDEFLPQMFTPAPLLPLNNYEESPYSRPPGTRSRKPLQSVVSTGPSTRATNISEITMDAPTPATARLVETEPIRAIKGGSSDLVLSLPSQFDKRGSEGSSNGNVNLYKPQHKGVAMTAFR